MSRAFVRESDADNALPELPERPVSEHPNLVTAEGLALIEAALAAGQEQQAAAQAAGDKAALARVARDLRYWAARRATAHVMPAPEDHAEVQFGATVTVVREGSAPKRYRIVGEDEADPARGSVSFVSPLAQALLGQAVGDIVAVGPSEMEILAIE